MYKRQALGGTGAAGVLSVLVSGSKTVADIGKVTIYAKKDVHILATAVSKPVSYTHLDVYKRQGYYCKR